MPRRNASVPSASAPEKKTVKSPLEILAETSKNPLPFFKVDGKRLETKVVSRGEATRPETIATARVVGAFKDNPSYCFAGKQKKFADEDSARAWLEGLTIEQLLIEEEEERKRVS